MRELAEECGLSGIELGPWIWRREHEFTWNGVRYLQQERFYLARVDPFELTAAGWTEEEQVVIAAHRWWPVDEILGSQEVFAPRRMGALLRSLLHEGPPAEPIDAGE